MVRSVSYNWSLYSSVPSAANRLGTVSVTKDCKVELVTDLELFRSVTSCITLPFSTIVRTSLHTRFARNCNFAGLALY